MKAVSVRKLKKVFRVNSKGAGIFHVLKSFIRPEYKNVYAVNDVSFEIDQGELVGFIGPNGAGKTTTLKCLSGLLYPSAGEIKVLGHIPFERKYDFLKNISLIMGQKNQLWWDLPATETFKLNREIYEIKDSDYEKRLNELTQLLDGAKLLNIPVRKLSLGQRMKMELIAALLHTPKIMFLDEPTIGLDVVMQKNMRDFIYRYNRKYNATIILTSHNMADVKYLCKRIIMINKGRIIYDGSLDRLVGKFANHKTVTLTLNKKIEIRRLSRLGEVKTVDFPKVTMIIDRKKSKFVAVELLKKFPIEDFNIDDPAIEDVIRTVFTGRQGKK